MEEKHYNFRHNARLPLTLRLDKDRVQEELQLDTNMPYLQSDEEDCVRALTSFGFLKVSAGLKAGKLETILKATLQSCLKSTALGVQGSDCRFEWGVNPSRIKDTGEYWELDCQLEIRSFTDLAEIDALNVLSFSTQLESAFKRVLPTAMGNVVEVPHRVEWQQEKDFA